MFTIGTVEKHVSKCCKDSDILLSSKIDLQMHEGMQPTECFIKTQGLCFCIVFVWRFKDSLLVAQEKATKLFLFLFMR